MKMILMFALTLSSFAQNISVRGTQSEKAGIYVKLPAEPAKPDCDRGVVELNGSGSAGDIEMNGGCIVINSRILPISVTSKNLIFYWEDGTIFGVGFKTNNFDDDISGETFCYSKKGWCFVKGFDYDKGLIVEGHPIQRKCTVHNSHGWCVKINGKWVLDPWWGTAPKKK